MSLLENINPIFQVNISAAGVSRTVGTTTLTAAQLTQLQLATSKGSAAVLQSALQNVLRGSGNIARLPRPQMITANPSATGQTAVIRPHQLQQGQQRIALHRPGVIQGTPRQTIALQPGGAVRTPSGQIVVGSPQGAQNMRQQIVVASAGGQHLQAGGSTRQIIMTQGGTQAVRSGQILQVTGAGGHVQQIVVSQGGQIVLSPQPQQPTQK